MKIKISIKNAVPVLLAIALLSTIALAIPNSLTLQGKLTNIAGASQQGTFNFTFRIYDAASNGNVLWQLADYNITTDANGIYDVILTGINLSFADQYYLGITVSTDNESSPRINLTSAPYSFRANTSELLNPNASYFVRNLSVTGNATIGDGTTTLAISTQGFNLTTIGNVFIGRNLSVAGNTLFVDSLNQRVGINTTTPAQTLTVQGTLNVTPPDVGIAGTGLFVASSGRVGINTTSPAVALDVVGRIRATNSPDSGNMLILTSSGTAEITLESTDTGGRDYWMLSTGSGASAGAGKLAFYDNTASAYRMALDSSGRFGINTTSPSQTLHVIGTLNITSGSGTQGLFQDSSGNVGIGTTDPKTKLHVYDSANGDSNNLIIHSEDANVGEFDQIVFRVINGINATGIRSEITASGDKSLQFLTTTDDTTSAENMPVRMTIDHAGKVGINTTVPAQTLTVQGTLNVSQPGRSGDLFINSNGQTGFGTVTPNILGDTDFGTGNLRVNINNSGNAILGVQGSVTGELLLVDNGASVGKKMWSIASDDNNLLLRPIAQNGNIKNNTLTLLSEGNIGINTNAPTKRLSVNGTIDAITFDPSASPNPVMNTTGNNLTISSAAGSVIIRLG